MGDNVIDIGPSLKAAKASELLERIHELILEYSGEISLIEVLGVLSITKEMIMQDQFEELE